MTSLGIRCIEGFNGGLAQSFMLEVRDMSTQVNLRPKFPCGEFLPNIHFIFPFAQEIRANFTSPLARFAVSNLHPGSLYIASIYAFNAKGRSDPAVLPAAMLRLPEKQLTSEKGKRTLDILLIENGAEHQSHFSSQRNCAFCVSKVGVCESREGIADFDKSIADQHQRRSKCRRARARKKNTEKS